MSEASISRVHSAPSLEGGQGAGLEGEAKAVELKSSRLEWLDALRGFTMILVVMYHVFTTGFSGNVQKGTAITFMMLFRMPTFFFISGFLAYKASAVWSSQYLGQMLWKKVKVQLIPTIVFLTAFLMLMRPKFWPAFEEAMASPTKAGYWFCWGLLQMFVIYYLISYVLERLKVKSAWPWIVVWLASVAVYATLYMPSWFRWHKADFWQYTSLVRTAEYFQFFIFGTLVHRFWKPLCRVMDSRWLFPLLITVAFYCTLENYHWHHFRRQWANLPRTIDIYALVMVLLMFFRHYASWFTKERAVGRGLQYIGVRTLDVYLIHFFFLPHLPMIGAWLKGAGRNFVLETSITLAMSLLVIAFSLLTSNILRISPFLKKWLFGRE